VDHCTHFTDCPLLAPLRCRLWCTPPITKGSLHVIAGAAVGKKHIFIESCGYVFFPNDLIKLTSYF